MKYLQDKMPEIEAVTAFTAHYVKFRMEDTEQEIGMIAADSVFMNFFDIQLLKGTVNFLKCDGQEVAITKEFAKRLFSKEEDALGKEVVSEKPFNHMLNNNKSWTGIRVVRMSH
jgi:hypothetical protein